ncbi:hypothetical protein HN587_07435 [Candidatus Woesearchaeota archaeon]|jgi:hypothetical protein|nr:hypothetical protein [Candidatus Woesearchaeota archaeon]
MSYNKDNSTNQTPIDDLINAMYSSTGFLKPGEKIDPFAATMIDKGGIRSLFNPGVSYQDFRDGRISKSILIVNSASEVRNRLRKSLDGTVFTVHAAANYQDALKIIESHPGFRYAVIDNMLPVSRGAQPEPFADVLYDKITEKSSEARVFVVGENVEQLTRDYIQRMPIDSTSTRDIWKTLIKDSETYVRPKDNDAEPKNNGE